LEPQKWDSTAAYFLVPSNGLTMSNKEIAHVKTALCDLYAGITAIHERRRACDADAAALFRTGRYNGLQIRIVKQIVREFESRGEVASFDSVWQSYAAALNIPDEAAVADNVSPLDAILDRHAL
jgi:hypothetical protein